MTKKTWAYSDDLTASEFNRIQEQLWVVCTSQDRPDHVDGRYIYEVDTKRTYHSDGSSWIGRTDDVWTQFTPTFSNLTDGGGWSNAAYRYVHGDMHVVGHIEIGGSSPALGTNMTITIPNSETISATHRYNNIPFGQCLLRPAGSDWGGGYAGLMEYASSTTLSFWFMHIDASGSVAVLPLDMSVSTSTFPVTLAEEDVISFNFYVPLT